MNFESIFSMPLATWVVEGVWGNTGNTVVRGKRIGVVTKFIRCAILMNFYGHHAVKCSIKELCSSHRDMAGFMPSSSREWCRTVAGVRWRECRYVFMLFGENGWKSRGSVNKRIWVVEYLDYTVESRFRNQSCGNACFLSGTQKRKWNHVVLSLLLSHTLDLSFPLPRYSQPTVMQQPTCTNVRIRSTGDAHKIFGSIKQGLLHMVTRRLDAEERLALKSGCVYAWEERGPHSEITGLGIERFTEGRRWSPSRVREVCIFSIRFVWPTYSYLQNLGISFLLWEILSPCRCQ